MSVTLKGVNYPGPKRYSEWSLTIYSIASVYLVGVSGIGGWNGSGEDDTDSAQALNLRHRFTRFIEPIGFHY